jgi:D-proline reductase (dithiol) PrdB
MATYNDLSLPVRLFLKGYPFSRYAIAPTPCATLARPLRAARIALVTTAGLHTPDQPDFDYTDKRGDCSVREIPNSMDVRLLRESHRSQSFDHRGVESDRNLAFPLDRFRELVARGAIGELNYRHFSLMGSIVGPRRLIETSAPDVARALRQDAVEAVFLTPV